MTNIQQRANARKTYADDDTTWAAILDFYRTLATDIARWRAKAAARREKSGEAA